MTGPPRHTNWAGNQAYHARRIHSPRSIEALQGLVRTSTRIRAVGSRHSFNEIADTTGDLVSLTGLPRTVEVDAAGRRVTVGAGLRYGDVAGILEHRGLALANLASLPHISIAGACATGTHGSGVALGSLATAVSGLEFVGTDGDLRTVDRASGDAALAASVVSLGALGIVTRLTLDVEPTFRVRQQVFDEVPFDAVAADLDSVAGAAYSVSLFTDWHAPTFQVWLKHRVRGDGGPLPRSLLGVPSARVDRHPIPGVDPSACTVQRGVAGPWHLRLPHFRMGFTPSAGDELQSEYFVDRRDAPAALEALARLGPRIAPLLQVSEVRFVAADDLWLSPAYRRASATLHFTWRPDWPAVRRLLPAIEDTLEPFAPRPHWGKLFTMDADLVRSRYARLGAFADLARGLDPSGRFTNAFVARYVLDAG